MFQGQILGETKGEGAAKRRCFIRIESRVQYTTTGKVLRSAANCLHWAGYGIVKLTEGLLHLISKVAFPVLTAVGLIGVLLIPAALPAWAVILLIVGCLAGGPSSGYVLGEISAVAANAIHMQPPEHTPKETWNLDPATNASEATI